MLNENLTESNGNLLSLVKELFDKNVCKIQEKLLKGSDSCADKRNRDTLYECSWPNAPPLKLVYYVRTQPDHLHQRKTMKILALKMMWTISMKKLFVSKLNNSRCYHHMNYLIIFLFQLF